MASAWGKFDFVEYIVHINEYITYRLFNELYAIALSKFIGLSRYELLGGLVKAGIKQISVD